MIMASSADGAASPGATHGCVRCGRPVPLDVALCEVCNPLGLAQPAPAQAHGTVAVAVVVAVAALALLAGLARSGIGPFDATVTEVAASPPTLVLTISATNRGSAVGAARCRVTDSRGRVASVATERIQPGATVTFTRVVTGLGSDAGPAGSYSIACDA
jgi:hypothetical protein